MLAWFSRLREWLTLARARKIVTARSRNQNELIRQRWAAARARLDVAERLDPRTELTAALPLYRDGFVAIASAALAATEATTFEITDPAAAWHALEVAWPKLGTGVELAAMNAAQRLFVTSSPLQVAQDDSDACEAMNRLTRLVRIAIEPRSSRRLAILRATRITLTAGAIVGLAAWTIPPMFAKKSLAEHKPVKLSSSHPRSVAAPDGDELVNGRIEHTYGAHTDAEDNPWMLVDLEQPTRVRRIVVYNRGDGWLTDSIPLRVDVGLEPEALYTVATRTTLFTQYNPWTIALDQTVRFIRLRKVGHGAFALAEVSVY